MSLSHLYLHLENDLHINNSTVLHQNFSWLQPVQAKFTSIRVLTVLLCRHANASYSLYAFIFYRQKLAIQLNSLIRVSRRALFNSLLLDKFRCFFTFCFKILFIFRSHYLFSIGLLTIFSLRWDIPPFFRHHSQSTLLFSNHNSYNTLYTRLSLLIV